LTRGTLCQIGSIGLDCAVFCVLHPRQHSIGYMGDGFYRSIDPTNSIKVLKEEATKKNLEKLNNKIQTKIRKKDTTHIGKTQAVP